MLPKGSDMADITFYKLLGITSERSVEIARSVRPAYSESNSPAEWVKRLVEEFGIARECVNLRRWLVRRQVRRCLRGLQRRFQEDG
jgi:hypothetical protein